MKNTLLFTLLLYLMAGCAPKKVKFDVTDLRCEYLVNPVGLETSSPRLSWKINATNRGAAQSSYQVMVATREELLENETPDLWNTGMIRTSQSVQVPYGGNPLTSGMKVYWRVRIRNEGHYTSAWSKTATWEMGLMDSTDWKPLWIKAPETINTGNWNMPAPLLRKEFNLGKKVANARVRISGLGYYELYINGNRIGDHVLSPNMTNYDRRSLEKWDEPRIGNMTTRVLYETHDITGNLVQGNNAVGVILGNGWYIQADRPGDRGLWYNTPRLAARFELTFEDGTTEIITTGESWKTAVSPLIFNSFYTGEIYDARMEQPGWNLAGFDDISWKAAERAEAPTGKMVSQVSPPDRIIRTIRPVSVTEPVRGTYRFDLGEMISGWARLKISGPRGTAVHLRFLEELGPGYNQEDTYILKGGEEETWEPRFTWHGFRYVDVSGIDFPLTADNLEGRVVNTDVGRAGTFECSSKLLNKILENYIRTQSGNMHGGVPSDCPHRERLGYTGDGQISAKAAICNFDMSQFYTKWLNDIRDAQNHRTGYVPNTTPYMGGGGGTAWGSAMVIIPCYMYLYYGDTRILLTHYEGMKAWVDYMKGQLNSEGILPGQGLGEWVPPAKVELPEDYVNSCYYFHCCRLMASVSGVLGKESDQEYFNILSRKAAKDIEKKWFDAGSFSWSTGTQGAATFPLGFGINPANTADSVFNRLADHVVRLNKAHFDTGILATPLLLDVLTQFGRADIAYALMNQSDFPGFGYMIGKGATTIWETWLGDASHSHPMFGSVCAWFYESLAGIVPDPALPGFKNILIRPHPVSALSYVNCSYPSQYGTIVSNWKFSGKDFGMEVVIPANCTASIFVPGEDENLVTESNQPSIGRKGIEFAGKKETWLEYRVGAGHYNFNSPGIGRLLKKTILPTPVIHPADSIAVAGESIPLKISCDVAGSTIRFTTDGTEPDSLSAIYTADKRLTQSATIRARAFKKGFEPSFTATGRTDFVTPGKNGLQVKYYLGAWKELPDFSAHQVVKTGKSWTFTLDGISPPADKFGLVFEGRIAIKTAGTYEFSLLSNDGSRLYIDDKLVADNDGSHSAENEKTGSISLSEGLHPIRLQYFQAGGGMFLSVRFAGPGIKKQNIPADALYSR